MTVAYATRRNIFALGLRAEVFAARARAIESLDIATGVFRLASHGFEAGLPLINFFVQGSAVLGRASALLPPELDASIVYQPSARNGSGNLFTVAPVNGATITTFTNAGTGVFSIQADVGPTLDAILLDESSQVDNSLTAHSPPIERDSVTGLYPQILTGIIARRSALRARLVLGLANPVYAESFVPIEEAEADDNKRLAEWMMGRGILPTPTDQNTVPDNAPRFRACPPATWIRRAL